MRSILQSVWLTGEQRFLILLFHSSWKLGASLTESSDSLRQSVDPGVTTLSTTGTTFVEFKQSWSFSIEASSHGYFGVIIPGIGRDHCKFIQLFPMLDTQGHTADKHRESFTEQGVPKPSVSWESLLHIFCILVTLEKMNLDSESGIIFAADQRHNGV